MKFIHQSCLELWLSHSGKSHCDICNHVFHFSPVYAESAPRVIGWSDGLRIVLSGNIFQSQLPVRMNEKAIDTISVTYDGSDTLKKTRVPGDQNLSILDDENKYIVSETFLNL
jgi:hypothetical protein